MKVNTRVITDILMKIALLAIFVAMLLNSYFMSGIKH